MDNGSSLVMCCCCMCGVKPAKVSLPAQLRAGTCCLCVSCGMSDLDLMCDLWGPTFSDPYLAGFARVGGLLADGWDWDAAWADWALGDSEASAGDRDLGLAMYEAVIPLEGEWSGSPDPNDPDNFWIDDRTGERVNAWKGANGNAT